MAFFNKKQSTFTPYQGRDTYLDFYVQAITEEILHKNKKTHQFSNISKSEMLALRNLSNDDSIIIKKADKSNTIVIMDCEKYKDEVERQLKNKTYYEQQISNPEQSVKSDILKCMYDLKSH